MAEAWHQLRARVLFNENRTVTKVQKFSALVVAIVVVLAIPRIINEKLIARHHPYYQPSPAPSLLHLAMASSRKRAAVIDEGADAARRFEDTMNRVLRVSKEELARREANYQEASRTKPRRGPKPMTS